MMMALRGKTLAQRDDGLGETLAQHDDGFKGENSGSA